MRKIVKLLAIAFLCVLAATFGAYAVIKYTEKIGNTAMITGYEVKLWRVDTSALVMNISWGQLETGMNKTSDQVFNFAQKLSMKNTGDFDVYAAWKLNTTLPNGITLTGQYALSEGASWLLWPENDFSLLSYLSPGEVQGRRIQWTLNIPGDAPRGAINFDILLLAATTISG